MKYYCLKVFRDDLRRIGKPDSSEFRSRVVVPMPSIYGWIFLGDNLSRAGQLIYEAGGCRISNGVT